jgi:hypothetical protein
MAHDVFISYSARDKAVADAVCATLESRKIRCWVAPRDVLPGRTWPGAVAEAIGQSRIFVLVFSDGSNKSPQVIREVGEAVDGGIPIIPFRIEDVQPTQDLGFYIRSLHWLDALTPPLQRHVERLAETVELLLARAGESQPAAAGLEASTEDQTPAPTNGVPAEREAREAREAKGRRSRVVINLSLQLRIALMLLCVVAGAWWAVRYLQSTLTEVARIINQVLAQLGP